MSAAEKAARLAEAKTYAGMRHASFARSTGTLVVLYRSEEQGLDASDGQTWSTVCEDHAGICSFELITTARSFMSCPEQWCPTCSGEPDGSYPEED